MNFLQMDTKIVIFTNGYGEDSIAISIIKRLKANYMIQGFPMVGDGLLFKSEGISLIYSGKRLPSGGLSLREDFISFIKDIRHGLFLEFLKIVKKMRDLSLYHFYPIVIGDFYPLFLVYFFAKKRPFFILTSKTKRIKPFSSFEVFLLKTMSVKVFVRDRETEIFLKKYGIDAIYLGNPVIREIGKNVGRLPFLKKNKLSILFLPGSRNDVYKNAFYMIKIIDALTEFGRSDSFNFLFHLSNSTSFEKFLSLFPEQWIKRNIENEKIYNIQDKERGIQIFLIKDAFDEALKSSSLVVGLSGTANEQSAAEGKPVIAFPIEGTHASSKRFTKRQMPILRENLIYFSHFEPKKIARKIIDLIFNKEELSFFRVKGKENLGKSAISYLSKYIMEQLER